jgi:hypothetical protein
VAHHRGMADPVTNPVCGTVSFTHLGAALIGERSELYLGGPGPERPVAANSAEFGRQEREMGVRAQRYNGP